jgi:hypothetical protein
MTQTNQNENYKTTNNSNEIWLENLRKNEDQRRKASQWFNMQPGEKATLQFLPDFGPVMKDFDGDGVAETLRYEYRIVDVNHLSSTNAIYQTTGFSADNKENLGAFPLSAKASPSTSKVGSSGSYKQTPVLNEFRI